MPVIGRLDGQVDEVLIAPLERRRRGAGDEPPAGQRGAATDKQDDLVKRASQDESAKDDARQDGGRDSAREELPVWLL